MTAPDPGPPVVPADHDPIQELEAHGVRPPQILIQTAAGWRPIQPRGGEPE